MIENFKKDELLLKCLQGEADEREYEAAYKWITADKSDYSYYERIRDAWIAAGIVTNLSEHNCNKTWPKIARRTGIQWFNTPLLSGFRNIAAVFLIALVIGGESKPSSKKVDIYSYSTDFAEKIRSLRYHGYTLSANSTTLA